MKRLLFAATMLATLLVSCMKSEIEVVTVIPSSEEFTASFDDATRTELDGTAVVWNEEDLLTIFTKTSHNRKYEIKSLSTDCRTATFSYVGFTGTDGTKITTNYALYPYDAEATLANGVITTEWASEQTYDAETGNLSYALMTAASETTNFTFANAGALLRFKLSKIVPDDFTLRGIKLTSATQNIAGEITIDLNGNKRAVVTDNGVDSITLEAIDTEITLDVQEFYVAMPAMSFNKGDLSVTFMFDEGNKEFALPAFELAQGSIKNIDYTIKDAEEFTGSTPGDTPTNNEIWYTNGSTTVATTPNRTDVFGANILSNTYDAEKECWVIKFDGEVTTIGFWAFHNCSSLTSITIPESVTTIVNSAFSYCTSLTSVTIPDSVTSIRDYAFSGCTSLTSVTIPDSVTSIRDYAFSGCTSLTSVTIGNGVTSIVGNLFYCCDNLQEFKGKFASSDGRCLIVNGQLCSFAPGGLTGYNIPDSVTTIGESAFRGCSSLTSITIPDSVTTIGNYAFFDCSSLTSVTIPDSVTSIGEMAFSNCSQLQEFKGKFASDDGRCLIIEGVLNSFAPAGLTEYAIPNSVTSIGSNAFEDCSGLTSVTIPDSVTTIRDYAFSGCSGLTSVNIPNGVTTIGDAVFRYCSSLINVTIPYSVTSIGSYAFYDCHPLASVYCKPTTPPTGGSPMFTSSASGRTIYVPSNSVSAYKSASGWSEYADSIVAYDFENGKVVVSNEIWYTNGSTTEATTPNRTDVFGANILSNTYDAEKECWVIKFDGEVTEIGGSAFAVCNGLTSVTIPDSVTTIGDYAFDYCTSLTSVTIPNSVTTIGICAFWRCDGLTSITIPDSVIEIQYGAFYACYDLTSITIPNSVTTIGISAFSDCRMLQEFKGKFASDDGRCLIQDGTLIAFAPAGLSEYAIPNSVTTIGEDAFSYCSSLTSVTIPDSVTSIGEDAFSYCSMLQEFKGKFASDDGRCLIIEGVLNSFAPAGLTEYAIPNSVTSIGGSAFQGCSGLTSVTIPDSVTTIGDYAFDYCTSLTSVTIPDSVTSIGNNVFCDCSGLTSVYCEATTPPTGHSNMFYNNAPDCKIYVPRNSVEAYKSASGWSYHASAIVGYDF